MIVCCSSGWEVTISHKKKRKGLLFVVLLNLVVFGKLSYLPKLLIFRGNFLFLNPFSHCAPDWSYLLFKRRLILQLQYFIILCDHLQNVAYIDGRSEANQVIQRHDKRFWFRCVWANPSEQTGYSGTCQHSGVTQIKLGSENKHMSPLISKFARHAQQFQTSSLLVPITSVSASQKISNLA